MTVEPHEHRSGFSTWVGAFVKGVLVICLLLFLLGAAFQACNGNPYPDEYQGVTQDG